MKGVVKNGEMTISGSKRQTKIWIFIFVMILLSAAFFTTDVHAAVKNGFYTKSGKTYYYQSGKKYTGWLTLKGKRYYFFRNTGEMARGWVKNPSGQKYYFYKKTGVMATGFVKNAKGNYYYFDKKTGLMTTGWFVNEKNQKRYFLKNGVMVTGLVKQSDGTYRYFDKKSGIMATGWKTYPNGKRYFARNGVMATGYIKAPNGKLRYFFKNTGFMATGFLKAPNGKYRYFDQDGFLTKGWVTVKGKKYYLDQNYFRVTGFKKIGGKKYYFNSNGIMQTGFVKISGNKYYFNSSGVMKTGFITVSNKKYYFNSAGVMQKGWVTVGTNRYYFNTYGIMQTGWISYEGESYYLYPATGIMAASTWVDSTHYVGTNGALIPGYSSQKFIWPLDHKWNTLSSYFGYRKSPGGVGSTNHQGIDIPASLNSPIYAIESGTLVGKMKPEKSGGAGNYLMINHGKGIISEYMHLNKFASGLKIGQKIEKGQIIGYVGSTGNSTGNHLHLGIIVNGTRRDPLNYVVIPE